MDRSITIASRSRRADPFGVAALAATGTLAAHELGYLVDSTNRVSHDYVSFVGPVVLLAACVAGWSAALRILRRDTGRAPSLVTLTLLQMAVFATMETVERAVTGSLATLPSAPVIAGLLLQPVVAFAALRLLSLGHLLVSGFVSPTPAPPRPQQVWQQTAVLAPILVEARSSIRLRGPPNPMCHIRFD